MVVMGGILLCRGEGVFCCVVVMGGILLCGGDGGYSVVSG